MNNGAIYANKPDGAGYNVGNIDRSDLNLRSLLEKVLPDNSPEAVNLALRKAFTSKERSVRTYKKRGERRKLDYPDFYFIEDLQVLANMSDAGIRYRFERYGEQIQAQRIKNPKGMSSWILPKNKLADFLALGAPCGRPVGSGRKFNG